MLKIIGLGEYMVSDCEEDVIKTFALASCVGLVVYNPKEKILGMVHIVLPKQTDLEAAKKPEGFFAETAVPLLFKKVFGKFPAETVMYQVSLYGGAVSKNSKDLFCIGERNVAKVEEILKAHNIWYDKKNTGGNCSRTISASVKDGKVEVNTQKLTI